MTLDQNKYKENMMSWNQMMVDTPRGTFEVFSNGEGDPICVPHHYSTV